MISYDFTSRRMPLPSHTHSFTLSQSVSQFNYAYLLPTCQSDSLSSLGDITGKPSSRPAHTVSSPSTGGEDSQSRLYGRALQTPCKDLPGLQEDTDRDREREREVQASHGESTAVPTVQYYKVECLLFDPLHEPSYCLILDRYLRA